MAASATTKRLGPARRRPLLLDAALALFAQSGYEGTSMGAVAAAAGVTKPVVYDSFPGGKAELFRALLDREEERVLGLLDAALERHLEEGPGAVLAAIIRAVHDAPDTFRIVYRSPHGSDPAIVRRVERARARQEARMTDLARQWGAEDPELRGRALVALAELGLRLTLEDPERWPPERLAGMLSGP